MYYKDYMEALMQAGFQKIVRPTAVHHLLKDFGDYTVNKSIFYILPTGKEFIHVALVELTTDNMPKTIQLRYSTAADDILYGLRVKFREGDINNPEATLNDILALTDEPTLTNRTYFIRRRFDKETRKRAHLRARLIMFRDIWRSFWSFR